MAKVDINNIANAITALAKEYGEEVFQASEEGIVAAAEVLKKNLAEDAPRSENMKGTPLRKTFAIKAYRNSAYVGSTKQVEGANGAKIPLTNILEHSTTRGHKFMEQTLARSQNAMINAFTKKIEEQIMKG